MARKKKRKSLTGFPLADKALGTAVGGITTGIAMDELGKVGGYASYGKPMMATNLLLSTMPKKRKKRRR